MAAYHIKDYIKLMNAVTTLKDPAKSKRSKTMASNYIDKVIGDAFRKHSAGLVVPVTRIPKVYQVGREAVMEGRDLNEHMQRAIKEHGVQL
jgi:hypothetical protein